MSPIVRLCLRADSGSAIEDGAARLSWGEVLGVTEYRLYRKKPGECGFTVCYRGLERIYAERDASLHRPDHVPTRAKDNTGTAIQYYVAAVNGNGEGNSSMTVDTDPCFWRNWTPKPGEPFRRTEVCGKYGTMPNDGIGPYYPD
ncbi:MAG: hypothetical protein P4K83_01370 [Terracidiphilus sp.]|nr:hypothetical protein [Terracidiphilus sp.]